MKNTKILFLNLYTFGLTGGIEKVCRSLAKALTDLSARFQLYAMHDRNTDLDKRYLDTHQYKGFNGQKIYFSLAAVLKGINSNIVILSHINLLAFGWLIKKISPRTKIILYAHGIEIWEKLPNWKRKFLQEKVEVWAVSEYTAAKITTIHQLNRKKISILHNCLDPYFSIPNQFERSALLLQHYHLQHDQPILFTLSRLSAKEAYKGYDQILAAMPSLLKKYPDLHYLLAGKADEQEELRVKNLIEQFDLKTHVTLCGFIEDEELSEYFKLGSVFVMPSTHEGFGIVFIEAAACGAKIIGGNADGSVDALLHGQLGTLVNPQSVEEIGMAIDKNLTSVHHPSAIQRTCIANFGYSEYPSKIGRLILA